MKNKKTITLLFEIIMLLNFIFYLITKDNMFVVAMIFCGIEMICNWLSMIHAKQEEKVIVESKAIHLDSNNKLENDFKELGNKLAALGRSFYE